MEVVIWRVRLAVLWIFAAGGWLVSFSIDLLMPGVIQEMMVGQIGGVPKGARFEWIKNKEGGL